MRIHKLFASALLISISLVSLAFTSDNAEVSFPKTKRAEIEVNLAGYGILANVSYSQDALVQKMEMPQPDPDGRIQTLNKMGAMSPELDPTSKAFVDEAANPSVKALEIGAAYGLACLEALKKGAASYTVNDLDTRHLKILMRRAEGINPGYLNLIRLLPGRFPDEVELLDNHFDLILIARVLHFMNPDQAVNTLSAAYKTLKPGGKIYAVMLSPYVRGFASFIPTFEQRIANGDSCPGYVESLLDIADRTIVPESALMNMDKKPFLFFNTRTATDIFEKAGFNVVKSVETPLAYKSSIWQLDGRENIGIIAEKPL